MTPAETLLTPIVAADFPLVRALAGTIWRQHYSGIVSAAQIDFMLAGRFNDEALRDQAQAADRWLELLRVSGEPVGYCGYEVAEVDVEHRRPDAMKLAQLYVLASHRGMGLGRFMLGHVEERAHALGSRSLWLQVNRKNAAAIGFYRKMGFVVAREAVFDIGGGFVMDDYVMAKSL